MNYRPILNNAERQRNERLRQLHAQRTKVPHESNKPPQTKYLTQAQMDKVKELVKEGLTREEAVAFAIDNIK